MSAIKPSSQSDLKYYDSTLSGVRTQIWMWGEARHSFDDHPAVILDNGSELQWWKHGLRHRDESHGPAWIKYHGGIEAYYNTGQLHRNNGPALITVATNKWYNNGQLHRIDGPAIIQNNNLGASHHVEWWLNNVKYDSLASWATAGKIDLQLVTMLALIYG
jgi:hypothetical protein